MIKSIAQRGTRTGPLCIFHPIFSAAPPTSHPAPHLSPHLSFTYYIAILYFFFIFDKSQKINNL